jgi:(5-formylfuran-3-yl)methyl phosphate synthase
MLLLVSVATAADAVEAVAGGAHVIDAKDPTRGALGAVSARTLLAIRSAVADARPLSAALGDATDERTIERDAYACAASGVSFVKLGCAGITSTDRAVALLVTAVRGASAGNDGHCGVVAVAYADSDAAVSLTPHALIDVAARAGASGVLIDTADKAGPGLRTLMPASALAAWVAHARGCGLRVALAGQLTAHDIPFLRDTAADIVGVRGAACHGGRMGHIASAKVRALLELM